MKVFKILMYVLFCVCLPVFGILVIYALQRDRRINLIGAYHEADNASERTHIFMEALQGDPFYRFLEKGKQERLIKEYESTPEGIERDNLCYDLIQNGLMYYIRRHALE